MTENQCVICLDSTDTVLYNNKFKCECKCFFHKKCWQEYVRDSNTRCPYCRNPIVDWKVRYAKFYGFMDAYFKISECFLFVFLLVYLPMNIPFIEENIFAIFFISSNISLLVSLVIKDRPSRHVITICATICAILALSVVIYGINVDDESIYGTLPVIPMTLAVFAYGKPEIAYVYTTNFIAVACVMEKMFDYIIKDPENSMDFYIILRVSYAWLYNIFLSGMCLYRRQHEIIPPVEQV
jgi:hypothetical protein